MALSGRVLPYIGAAAGLVLVAGFYLALFYAPPDYQQGETVRMMFVHVPSATLATQGYTVLAAASAIVLIWRHPLADVCAQAAAPIGAAFTFLALLTGALWGKPMWGAWWVWDARLTSVLVQFLLYLGYMALRATIDDPQRGQKAGAILALVGFINVPIIRYSVDWWNTLHQPASLIRADGPAIHPDILLPLLVMMVGFGLFYVTVLLIRMRAEILRQRVRVLRLARADQVSG